MNAHHETKNVLKRSMMASTTDEEVRLTNTVYQDACKTHEQTLAKQEKRLLEAVEQVSKHENMLKFMYTKMMEAFENTCDEDGLPKNESVLKYVAAGVIKRSEPSDVPSIKMIDFKTPIPTLTSLGLDAPFVQKPLIMLEEAMKSAKEESTNKSTKEAKKIQEKEKE